MVPMPKPFDPFDQKYLDPGYNPNADPDSPEFALREDPWGMNDSSKTVATRVLWRFITEGVLEKILLTKDLSPVKSTKYTREEYLTKSYKPKVIVPVAMREHLATGGKAEEYKRRPLSDPASEAKFKAFEDSLYAYINVCNLVDEEGFSMNQAALIAVLDYIKTRHNADISKWDALPETDFFKEVERYITARIDMLSTVDKDAQINALMCLLQPFENAKMQVSAHALLIPFLADKPLRDALAAYPKAQEMADVLLLTLCMFHGRTCDEDLLFVMQAQSRLKGDGAEITFAEFNQFKESLSNDTSEQYAWLLSLTALLTETGQKMHLRGNTPETMMYSVRDKLIQILTPAFKEENILQSTGRRISSWFGQFATRSEPAKKEDKQEPRKPGSRGD